MRLEQTIADCLPENLYKKRAQLAGGQGDSGTGFAVWRRLFRKYKGSGDAVKCASIEVVRDCPRCNKLSELG